MPPSGQTNASVFKHEHAFLRILKAVLEQVNDVQHAICVLQSKATAQSNAMESDQKMSNSRIRVLFA